MPPDSGPDCTVLDCDDDEPCTDDLCNTTTRACEHRPLDIACDDGLFCNGFSTCAGGSCAAGSAPCSDVCLTCLEGSGCVFDDGSACGADGTCEEGQCRDCGSCITPNCETGGDPGCDEGGGCMPCGIIPV